eukprot:6973063-Alexandrium_andersonii.AAC.1
MGGTSESGRSAFSRDEAGGFIQGRGRTAQRGGCALTFLSPGSVWTQAHGERQVLGSCGLPADTP